MRTPPSLAQVLQLAQELSPTDQLQLIARLAPQISAAFEEPRPGEETTEQVPLSAEDYRVALQRAAQPLADHRTSTVEAVLSDWRSRHAGTPGSVQFTSAWARLAPHLGAVDGGYATGADNERIDADLARAYADTHDQDA